MVFNKFSVKPIPQLYNEYTIINCGFEHIFIEIYLTLPYIYILMQYLFMQQPDICVRVFPHNLIFIVVKAQFTC